MFGKVGSLIECKASGAAISASAWIHALKMLALIFTGPGICKTADRGMRAQQAMEQGSAAPVQSADKDELHAVHSMALFF